MESSWVWGFNWATMGEIMRFFLACAWIAGIAVLAVHVLRYAQRIWIERVRWWK
jgi:hypothetical protein